MHNSTSHIMANTNQTTVISQDLAQTLKNNLYSHLNLTSKDVVTSKEVVIADTNQSTAISKDLAQVLKTSLYSQLDLTSKDVVDLTDVAEDLRASIYSHLNKSDDLVSSSDIASLLQTRLDSQFNKFDSTSIDVAENVSQKRKPKRPFQRYKFYKPSASCPPNNFNHTPKDIVTKPDVAELYKDPRYSHLPYFTPEEVARHYKSSCIWVTTFHLVRDLSSLVQQFRGRREVIPLLKHAGQDISHWFDPRTGDIKHHIHPITGVQTPFTPHGPLPHVATPLPSYAWEPVHQPPWWRDDSNVVGRLTEREILLDVLNVLTGQHTYVSVCSEDTLHRIAERYSRYNSNTSQYVWRYNGRLLDMDSTLGENGVADFAPLCDGLFIPRDLTLPCVSVHFKDDIF